MQAPQLLVSQLGREELKNRTVEALRELIKERGLHLPSKIRRKEDIISFILGEHKELIESNKDITIREWLEFAAQRGINIPNGGKWKTKAQIVEYIKKAGYPKLPKTSDERSE